MMNTAQNPLPVPVNFSFESKPIRTTMEDNDIWFVALDVCRALDIAWRGNTLDPVPDNWKGMRSFRTPSSDTDKRGGGKQNLKVINEPAVYKLAFRSNKPEADRFTNWVASEVLPAIRKQGCYGAPVQEAKPAELVFQVKSWAGNLNGEEIHIRREEKYLSDYDTKRFIAFLDRLSTRTLHFILVEEFADTIDMPYSWVMENTDPDKFERIHEWHLRAWPQNPLYRAKHRPAQYITTFGIRKLMELPLGPEIGEKAKALTPTGPAVPAAPIDPPPHVLSENTKIAWLQTKVFHKLGAPDAGYGLTARQLDHSIAGLNMQNFRAVMEPFLADGLVDRRVIKEKGCQTTIYRLTQAA